MQGVTTAIVAFIFVCIIFPHIIKNRPQYYAAVAVVLLSILVDAGGFMVSVNEKAALRVVAYVFCAILQVIAIVLLLLSAGGLRARELGKEFARAYEVMRRGEDEREVIIPIHGQHPAGHPQQPVQPPQPGVAPMPAPPPGMPQVVVISPPPPPQPPPQP